METRAAGLPSRLWKRYLSLWTLPKVDEASGVKRGESPFEQSDLALFWQRLRAHFTVVVILAALVLAASWGPFALHPLDDTILSAPLVVAVLASGLLVDAWVRIRRRNSKVLLSTCLDATAIAVGFCLLQIDIHVVAAPFLYTALTATIVLPLGQALWMWCYDGLLVALLVASPSLARWLGPPPTGTRMDVAVWVTGSVFSLLCLFETLLLTRAVRRFVRTSHARLTHQAGQLEHLVRSRTELMASVSHELRTPLTVMVGYVAELVYHWDAFPEAERRELLGIAAAQGTDLAGIIEDLLVAAQTDAGELTIRADRVNLGRLVTEAVNAFPMGNARPIGVSPTDAWVWAEAARVRQILRNLLSNALRYGGPTIEVETARAGPKIHLRVCDDGPGLAHDRWEQIFEMYDRNRDGTDTPGSIGIGLTISRRLARLMSGDLTYRYEAGRSVFDLTLPPGPDNESGHPAE